MSYKKVLIVENLSKTFQLFTNPSDRFIHAISGGRWRQPFRHQVLSSITFSLKEGETLGVLGRNGAGKTTLLGLLSESLKPTSGCLICPKRVGTLIALGAGFDPERTGLANLREWGALHMDGPFTAIEETWIAQFTELGEALNRPVKTYSQGMLLRLGFAVATARRPDLLIIDEVMAVGDFFFRRKCHDLIRMFVDQGSAAVLVSHDYTEILQFCRTALVLERGQEKFYGDAATAVNQYLHSSAAQIPESTRRIAQTESHELNLDIPWPEDSQRINIHSLEPSEEIQITSIACCDGNLSQRWVFSQGEMASFFVSATAKRNLQVPIVSVVITNERGVIIHGSSSHMKGSSPCKDLQQGKQIFVRCDIGLALRYGEYQIDISIGECPVEIFSQRHALTFEALGGHVRQVIRMARIGVIAVVPRQGGMPTQLTHHGVADLPGTVMTIIG